MSSGSGAATASIGLPSVSTSRSSTPGSARPTDPGFGAPPIAFIVITGPPSVRPYPS